MSLAAAKASACEITELIGRGREVGAGAADGAFPKSYRLAHHAQQSGHHAEP
jgi:hypothetical protein